MSRTVIAAVVAVVIAALTAIAYFITTKQADQLVRTDAASDLKRSYQVVQRLKALEMVEVMNKVERLSARPEFVASIKSSSNAERVQQARIGFQKFTSDDKQGSTKPDIIALVDATGDILAMHDVPTVVPKQWKTPKGDSILPALNVVLGRRIIIADFWNYASKGMMKVGVAPIIDPDAPVNAKDPDGVVIIGAIVVAYAQTARSTQEDRKLLGTEIAYYDGKQVIASSFTHGPSSVEENTAKRDAVSNLLSSGKLSESGIQQISIEDVDYTATTVKLRRQHTKDLPGDYPPVTAGAVVLAPLEKAADDDSVGSVKWLILLLGGGALAIAMLGLYLSHRRLVAQVDQVEGGVTDIINGNVDRTFRPVGPELDGLANGLNVMLARLLGRPEPGEEEFDEEGNPIVPGRVEFDESEERPAPDPDLAALAQESEPDYYKRVYTDYLAARKASGAPDEVSFENFIAKLKVNEGKLKAQYQCRAVRFRVVTKDGKVTLKPVPIFRVTTLTGLARLATEGNTLLDGRRIGLLCNPTAVDTEYVHAIELVGRRVDLKLVALFGPEHGVRGDAQDMISVDTATDPRSGLPVHSLYGTTEASLAPTPEMLEEIDVMVYDVQDVGSRYYTFVWTMVLAMRACAKAGKAFCVLDRPNPLGGVHVEGPAISPGFESFVGLVSCPNRHGLTAGEIARWRHAVEKLDLDLAVISMRNWQRDMRFDHTGLPWVMPSPNMPTVDTALVYPGMCLVEGTELSEGRGTTRPFELAGAPHLDGHKLATVLTDWKLPGVTFRPVVFTPMFQKHAGKACGGVQLHVTNPETFRPYLTGVAFLKACHDQAPGEFRWRERAYEFVDKIPAIDLLAGSAALREGIASGQSLDDLARRWPRDEGAFAEERAEFLLYAE